LPEDKYALVQAFQRGGHVVGMCGDGANDAPALRQAQMGIAVFTATDVAKSAAGIVLTEPGLGGVVAAVREGRTTFQRILTYTFRSIVHKVVQVLFLLAGLVISGTAVLTPLLMVLMMVAGDFFALSSATDNVRASSIPNVWRIGNLTIASIVLGLCDLVFCVASLRWSDATSSASTARLCGRSQSLRWCTAANRFSTSPASADICGAPGPARG
jgi:H+-transporting ATPase